MNAPQNTPQGSTTVKQTNYSFTPAPGPVPKPPPAAPAQALSEKAALIERVRARLSGPPSRADGSLPNKELNLENRLRAWVLAGSDEGAARRTGETAKTIGTTREEFDGPLLAYPRDTPPEERQPLPAKPDDSETSTDD